MIRLLLFVISLSPLVAAWAAIVNRSISALIAVLLCYKLVVHTFELTGHFVSIKSLRQIKAAVDSLGQDYDLKPFSLLDFVDEDTATNAPPVIVVIATPARPDVPPLASLKSYIVPFGVSLVILSDLPSADNPLRQFFIYHEIGHVSISGRSRLNLTSLTWLRLGAIYLPCLAFTENWPVRIAIIAVFFFHWLLDTYSFASELSADYYATVQFRRTYGDAATRDVLRLLMRKFEKETSDPRHERADDAREFLVRRKALTHYDHLIARGEGSDELILNPMKGDAISGRIGSVTTALRAAVCVVLFWTGVHPPSLSGLISIVVASIFIYGAFQAFGYVDYQLGSDWEKHCKQQLNVEVGKSASYFRLH